MLQPLEGYLIARVEDMPAATPAGVIIPDVARRHPQIAQVVATGANSELKEGDLIFYSKWGDVKARPRLLDPLLRVLREDHVLAVVQDD